MPEAFLEALGRRFDIEIREAVEFQAKVLYPEKPAILEAYAERPGVVDRRAEILQVWQNARQ